jgi:hypothetical protein
MRTSFWNLYGLRASALLALAPVILIAGCTQLKIKAGMRMNVATMPVTTMDLRLSDANGIAPGKKARLIATFTETGGQVWRTEGAGGGPIMWQDLTVTSTVVSANGSGEVSLPLDPRLSDGRTGHVVVTVPSHSDLHAELDVPLRYDLKYGADFSGYKGADGMSGTNGTDGMRGSDGNSDPQHAVAGGNGSNGSSGSDGMNGSRGGDGADVHIWLAPHPKNPDLIEAEVLAGKNKDSFYLIDASGGSLTVKTDGGRGGNGGKGGRGGRGGAGGSGWPSGMSGQDGLAGRDGFSGSDGSGGRITVTYDPAVGPHLGEVLHLSNWSGPKPVFESRRLNPLW